MLLKLTESQKASQIALDHGLMYFCPFKVNDYFGKTWQHFEENDKGSIEVGKHADLIVLDRNLFDTAPDTIYDTVVKRTVFAGETVYLSEVD